MSYSDFERKIAKPNGFAIYLPPDVSEARRTAQRRYEDAINALASSLDEAHLTALAAVERAWRNYGAVLLREDRQNRPHIYAK